MYMLLSGIYFDRSWFITTVILFGLDCLSRDGRYRMPQKPEDHRVSGIVVGGWYTDWSIDLKFGLECCSRDSLSFHLVDEELMERLYRLIYSCPKTQSLDLVVAPRVITTSPTAVLGI